MTMIKNFLKEEDGADMVEYALLIGLVALGALTAMTTFGTTLGTGFTSLGTKFTNAIK